MRRERISTPEGENGKKKETGKRGKGREMKEPLIILLGSGEKEAKEGG